MLSRVLLALFFVSGATGLMYQVIWVRQLQLIFGATTLAVAAVLGAFMGGLAVGGWAISNHVDRIRRPLQVYARLELGIGLYALVLPELLRAVEPLYLGLSSQMNPSPLVYGLIQLLCVGSLLILPTAFMGATLPLLVRQRTSSVDSSGRELGALYGANTAGAVAGTCLAGFVLLPGIGVAATNVSAAAANIALGVLALWLDRWAPEPKVQDRRSVDFQPEPIAVGVALALGGLASMVYEVAWVRLLTLVLGASAYAFALMLVAFLSGIALGGALGGPLADRVAERRGERELLHTLAALYVLLAAVSYVVMYAFPELPVWYVLLIDAAGAIESPRAEWAVMLGISVGVMTLPAILLGATLPISVRAVASRGDELGRTIGRLYSMNTAGGVVGALTAGFVLMPAIGVQGAVLAAAGLNIASAGVIFWHMGPSPRDRAVAVAVAAVVVLAAISRPPWNPRLMASGMYRYSSWFSDHSREGIHEFALDRDELLMYREGRTSVVTVGRNKRDGSIWIANNGKGEADNAFDMETQVLLGLLPLQFVEDPRDVLVIGLGSGITAGTVSSVDSVDHVDVVEIEAAVVEAAELFAEWNHHVLDDPRTTIHANDGRNHLLLHPRATWDVIISQPSNPWITGAANLFTLDFFEIGRSRLRPGGVWAQWAQLYSMEEADLKTLLATFASVHAHVLVYVTEETSDILMLGSDRPLDPLVVGEINDRFPSAAPALKDLGLRPETISEKLRLDRDAILELTAGMPINTDDNLWLEYSAPLARHRNTGEANQRWLDRVSIR